MKKGDLVEIDGGRQPGVVSIMHKDGSVSVETVSGTSREPERRILDSEYMPEDPETVFYCDQEALVIDEGDKRLLVVYVDGGAFQVVNTDMCLRGEDVRKHLDRQESDVVDRLAAELSRVHMPKPPAPAKTAMDEVAAGWHEMTGPFNHGPVGSQPMATIYLSDLKRLTDAADKKSGLEAQIRRLLRVIACAHQDGGVHEHFAWVDRVYGGGS